MAQEGRLNFGNMGLVIEVQGHYRKVGTLEATINFMTDSPAKHHIYPDIIFTPHENETLSESEIQYLYELMKSLGELRQRIGIKAGHLSLHTKEPEDYLRI